MLPPFVNKKIFLSDKKALKKSNFVYSQCAYKSSSCVWVIFWEILEIGLQERIFLHCARALWVHCFYPLDGAASFGRYILAYFSYTIFQNVIFALADSPVECIASRSSSGQFLQRRRYLFIAPVDACAHITYTSFRHWPLLTLAHTYITYLLGHRHLLTLAHTYIIVGTPAFIYRANSTCILLWA